MGCSSNVLISVSIMLGEHRGINFYVHIMPEQVSSIGLKRCLERLF